MLFKYALTTTSSQVTGNFLYAAGRNSNGVLGLNSSITAYQGSNFPKPEQIGEESWTSIAYGQETTRFAIRSDGALFAWGNNTYNQVGPSELAGTGISAVQVVAIHGYESSSYNGVLDTVYATLRPDGSLWTGGSSDDGALGLGGTFVAFPAQQQVGTDSWTQITGGRRHMAAIRSDGALFTWGTNGHGQLGDGTTISKSSPVQIGSSSWTQVDAGAEITAAIRSDGALFTWGRNGPDAPDSGPGQLGDGTRTDRSSPVQIGTSSWTQLSMGSLHASALSPDNKAYGWGLYSSAYLTFLSAYGGKEPTEMGEYSINPETSVSTPVLVKDTATKVIDATATFRSIHYITK